MISHFSTSDLGPPSTLVRGDGNSVAGESFSLVCIVETEDGVRSEDISIMWTGPDKSIIINGDKPVIEEPVTTGNVTTGRLVFSQLHTSDRGQYTCGGRILATSVGVDVIGNDSMNIIITSKLILYYYLHSHVN